VTSLTLPRSLSSSTRSSPPVHAEVRSSPPPLLASRPSLPFLALLSHDRHRPPTPNPESHPWSLTFASYDPHIPPLAPPGISFKTQALYVLVFLTRYIDLLTGPYVSLYNTVMKVFFIASSAYILYLMKFRFKYAPSPAFSLVPEVSPSSGRELLRKGIEKDIGRC
jgi:hypothetical protein